MRHQAGDFNALEHRSAIIVSTIVHCPISAPARIHGGNAGEGWVYAADRADRHQIRRLTDRSKTPSVFIGRSMRR
jgi:hypothetical protein